MRDQAWIGDGDTGFLYRLAGDAIGRRIAVQLAGNHFHQTLFVAPFKHRPTELLDQDHAVARTVETFGGIDILVNNASAISPTLTPDTDMKRFDLMHQINTRGTFLCSKLCLPHLGRSSNGHILMISPPLNMEERWFAPHVAYSLAKFGMSLCVLGLAGELRAQGIAVNALWPRTVIDTAALRIALAKYDNNERRRVRKPQIMADAAYLILCANSREFTGNFCVDEQVLRRAGETDLARYRYEGVREEDLLPDFFL